MKFEAGATIFFLNAPSRHRPARPRDPAAVPLPAWGRQRFSNARPISARPAQCATTSPPAFQISAESPPLSSRAADRYARRNQPRHLTKGLHRGSRLIRGRVLVSGRDDAHRRVAAARLDQSAAGLGRNLVDATLEGNGAPGRMDRSVEFNRMHRKITHRRGVDHDVEMLRSQPAGQRGVGIGER
jgi:hypothetical protein